MLADVWDWGSTLKELAHFMADSKGGSGPIVRRPISSTAH